jgi:hypothetical protein
MTRAIIGFPRASSSFALSGGSWNATYPLSNLQALPPSRVARSTDATTGSTIIIGATTGATARVGLIGLTRHNFSLNATIRVQLFSDNGVVTRIYDSGFVSAWPIGLYSSAADIANGNWTWLWWGGQDYNAASLRIDINDTGNSSGYVEAGWLEIAAQTQVSYNYKPGAQFGYRFRSQVTDALGGAKYVYLLGKPRTFQGTFDVPSSEALAQHWERWRQLDLDQPFLWLPNPDDPTNWPREAFLAQNVDPGPMSLLYFAQGSRFQGTPIKLEEVIG